MTFLLMLSTLLMGSYAMVGDDTDTIEQDVDAAQQGEAEDKEAEAAQEIVSLDEFLSGTRGDDALSGGAGNDTIFGQLGADTLFGGAGEDVLYSGSDWSYGDDGNHEVGELTRVDAAGDQLDGGAGNDTLWLGANGLATGGEGEDTFITFAGTNPNGDAGLITDFTAGEDQVQIDFPIHQGYFTEDFGTQDAINGLLSDYDADTDTTLITMDDQEVVALNGDHTGLSIAFYDGETDADAPIWFDVEGNQIAEVEGQAADIILRARSLEDVIGVIS